MAPEQEIVSYLDVVYVRPSDLSHAIVHVTSLDGIKTLVAYGAKPSQDHLNYAISSKQCDIAEFFLTNYELDPNGAMRFVENQKSVDILLAAGATDYTTALKSILRAQHEDYNLGRQLIELGAGDLVSCYQIARVSNNHVMIQLFKDYNVEVV